MKYLGIYIKDRKMYFFLTAFICGVTAVINYLYSAPPQAGLYAFKISLTVLVIVCAADYVHFYKKHENLQRHCHLKEVHALEEDAAHTAIERDYQQLVLKLIQEKAQLAEHMQKKQTDMLDYIARLVKAEEERFHATLADGERLLLQVMEENPQEVAEQDIKELKSELFKIDFYVEAVMNYLRLEDLSSDFRFETTAVEAVVKKAVKRFAGQFIHRQITLVMENLHSEIETDEKWLLFILEQLLSNAVKYTQKGGTVKIYEKETLLKSDTVLVIEDNGIGIQSEDLPRIMERGYTGYNGRGASKSSGIGLYLCKKAADQLGIDIEVESEPYHGTKVLLTIRQHHTRHE